MARYLPALLLTVLSLAAGLVALNPDGGPRSAIAAFSCGPTGSGHETHSKIQILVSGPRSDEVHWAFYVTPNPFNLVASLRVADNQAPDLNSVSGNMLLEDVCVTSAFDAYTVTVDPSVVSPCPLIQSTLTRYGPGPTLPNADPDTAAFRFETQCPTPTATPTMTPTATPTPIPATATPTFTPIPLATFLPTATSTPNPAFTATPIPTATPLPGVPLVTISVTPLIPANSDASAGSPINCGGSALVKVQATINGLPVPDGTVVALQTTLGSLNQSAGNTVAGLFTTILSLPTGSQVTTGAVSAVVNGTYALANATSNFTAQACASQTLAVRAPSITPPNTGDGGLPR